MVADLVQPHTAVGCRMSLHVRFEEGHLDIFPLNLGAVSDEHGHRFNQEFSAMAVCCLITAGHDPQEGCSRK